MLDTHTILWWQADANRLSPAADGAILGATQLLVSPLSLWEISSLSRQGRIGLDRAPGAWVDKLLRTARVVPAPLTPEAAVWAGQLDGATFPGDPIDRLIYASAHDLRIPLVTKDERLRAYASQAADIDVIW